MTRVGTLLESLQAYDPVVARRSGAGVLAAFAAIVFVGTLAAPLGPNLTIFVGYVCPSLLLLWGVVLIRAPWRWVDRALVVNPLLATTFICALDLITRDSSPGGQIAFCAPVLYAGSQLRIAGAVLVLLTTMGAELLTVLLLEPVEQALTDAGYVSIILVIITVLLGVAGVRQDRMLRQLQQLAAVDPLTGLVTRRVFDEAALNALRQANNAGIALVLADIDHFKTVNDTYGHPVGDDALAHVAELLRAHVGSEGVLCRLGGDEVAVLLPGADGTAALAVAERFVAAVRATPLRNAGRDLPLSVSAGIGFASQAGTLLRELYAAADASLYEAKRQGRDRTGRPVDAVAAAAAVAGTAAGATRPEQAAPGTAGAPAEARAGAPERSYTDA